MKQFFCVLAMLLACAGLLFLVSAPVNNMHGAEGEGASTHGEATAGHGEETHETAGAHGEQVHETTAGHAGAEK